uniref:cytokinin dehydrogenase n=1 Tax=Oryza meridionalis TaxID=40149 RepID=A0A0E0CI18_9ORYZ
MAGRCSIAFMVMASCLSVVVSGGLPGDLFALSVASKLRVDRNSTARASSDFGRIVAAAPEAVLHPATPADIAQLVRFSASSPSPFPVAPRGQGHSARGQSLAPGGVVVDMRALAARRGRVNVSAGAAPYVDAGGEQLWADVLRATLEHGLAPRVWTDYLRITVAGTLSNAGIGGQAFRHGPQIANVLELDVITGRGDMVTCSRDKDPDLFFAVLGGLGQFGIITRARIGLEPAPKRVRWVRLAYSDVVTFTRDQELLISKRASEAGFDYVEGQVQLNRTLTEGPKSTPFFSRFDIDRLAGLASESVSGVIYFIEGAMYYNESTAASVDQKLTSVLEQLSFDKGFVFTKDVKYVQFLDRVREEERVLRSIGMWDVPHPWLNLFVPQSRILDFDTGVLKGVFAGANPVGVILMYPMNRNMWEDRMTAVSGNDDMFYVVGLLRSAVAPGDVECLERENEAVLAFCDNEGIECKQYLPHYASQDGWRSHFGVKWSRVTELKAKYDPYGILSPGQRIFSSLTPMALAAMCSIAFMVMASCLSVVVSGGLPGDLFALSVASKLRVDRNSTARASSDFGRIVAAAPEAVLHPATPADIAQLVRFSASSPSPFPVAPRGQGHSARGQSLAPGGVVVDMRALAARRGRVNVSAGAAPYVDAGGEQLWADVLRATLEHGLAPRVWTDYLRITVAGTLSNAGIGGQAFRHGPQIANVLELDVITGTGDMVTCSRDKDSDLFFAVLGGLGQFGIITRARIGLMPAPKRVRWVRLAYSDVGTFTRDQELLISKRASEAGFDYVEGQVQLNRTLTEGPKSTPFFSSNDIGRLAGLASKSESGVIYVIECAMYYNESTNTTMDQKLESILGQLSFEEGFVFTRDVRYVQFLDRVREEERVLRSIGMWDVPHPWLNLFVPRSRILDFDAGVFKGVFAGANPVGVILMYPMNRNMWDDRMMAVASDDDVFYAVGLLRSAVVVDDVERLEKENEAVLAFCHNEDIGCKQYLPHYTSQDGWQRHFGAKWSRVADLKTKYDPHRILSPGQRIFSSPASMVVASM